MTFKIRADKTFGFIATHAESGREVARSHSRALLEAYCAEAQRLYGGTS